MGIFILGGFPPGPIFFIKIFILQSLISQRFSMLALGLIISSTIRLLAVCNCVLLTQIGVSYKFFRKPKGYSLVEVRLFLILIGGLTIFRVSLRY